METASPPPAPEAADRVPIPRLFLAFLRLGATAFGGPAMVSYMRELAVGRRRWIGERSFADGAAMCQSLPGATAMQMAAYIGLRVRGIGGALAAYLGFMLPAVALMLALSAAYETARDLRPVVAAFEGLRAVVVALVANAAYDFGRRTLRRLSDAPLALGAACALLYGASPGGVIAAAALLGLLLHLRRERAAPRPPPTSRAAFRAPLLRAAGATGLVVAAAAALALAAPPLFRLALVMMKVDLLAFGGGFASIPLMMHEVVDARGWMDAGRFMDGIALGQVTPGPLAVTATFVGHQTAGFPGAAAATVGVFASSFLVVLAATPFLDRLNASPVFRAAVRGVLISFVGLLLSVACQFAILVPWSWRAAALCTCALAALRLGADLLWVVIAGSAVSAFLFL